MLRPMWQSGEGIVKGEVAGKPVRKRLQLDQPPSCRFCNSLGGDGPGLPGKPAGQLPGDYLFSNWLFFL